MVLSDDEGLCWHATLRRGSPLDSPAWILSGAQSIRTLSGPSALSVFMSRATPSPPGTKKRPANFYKAPEDMPPKAKRAKFGEEIEDPDVPATQPISPPAFDLDVDESGFPFNFDYVANPERYKLYSLPYLTPLPNASTRAVGMGVFPGVHYETGDAQDWVILITDVVEAESGLTVAYKLYDKTKADEFIASRPSPATKVPRKKFRDVSKNAAAPSAGAR